MERGRLRYQLERIETEVPHNIKFFERVVAMIRPKTSVCWCCLYSANNVLATTSILGSTRAAIDPVIVIEQHEDGLCKILIVSQRISKILRKMLFLDLSQSRSFNWLSLEDVFPDDEAKRHWYIKISSLTTKCTSPEELLSWKGDKEMAANRTPEPQAI